MLSTDQALKKYAYVTLWLSFIDLDQIFTSIKLILADPDVIVTDDSIVNKINKQLTSAECTTNSKNSGIKDAAVGESQIDWLVFYGTSTKDRSICAKLPGRISTGSDAAKARRTEWTAN